MSERTGPVVRQRFLAIVALLALAILYFVVRILNTETLITNDEPFWLGRSANYFRAIVQWEPEYTYQMAHPGVPVMWMGAIAYWIHGSEYAMHFDTNLEWPFSIDDRLVAAGIDPLQMLQHARVFKLGFETALFLVSVLLIAVIATRLVAVLAGLLIALDPFLAGFGPLMHVDSLLAMSMFAAALTIVWAWKSERRTYLPWILAGGIAAIAVLTRTTGVVIAVPLLIACFSIIRESRFADAARSCGAWILGFATVYVAGWPALWVRPIETARAMIDWTIGAASDGHENPLFFLGEALSNDPGLIFYPVTILWRTTPLAWIGIVLFLLAFRSAAFRARIRPFIPVFAMAAMYLLVMSLGAKKFDRYVLPVYPVIALTAAFGFNSALSWIWERFPSMKRVVPASGLATIALLSLIPLSNGGPYRLNYYNEILSALKSPDEAIQIGWGEGAYEAIAFVEGEAARLGRPVTAQTFATPSERVRPPIRYFVVGDQPTFGMVEFTQVGLATADDWYSTDYFLFNIQQTQRNMASQYELFSDVEPIHTIELGGVIIWEIYSPAQLPLPDAIPET